MHIVFRTDASVQIGTGHVMRCLTLAETWREQDAKCTFICREHPGNLIELIRQRGFFVHVLQCNEDLEIKGGTTSYVGWLGADWHTDAEESKVGVGDEVIDWLVVDHYALDIRWERAMRANCRRILVIDDLADRMHNCDLLLDQNLGRKSEDYCGLLDGKVKTLIGPKYALMRQEFSMLRRQTLIRRQNETQLRHLLITMGGVDKDNVTSQVLTALQSCALPSELFITVVMGPHAPWLVQIQEKAAQLIWKTEVLVGVNNMAWLMARSDLAIGAAGSTSWERCCLGLATIQVVLAQNQVAIAQALNDVGAALTIPVMAIEQTMPTLIYTLLSADKRNKLSMASSSVTEGMGAMLLYEHMKE